MYAPVFKSVEDPFLQKKALDSLAQAGDEQKYLYDFSFGKKAMDCDFDKTNKQGKECVVCVLMGEEVHQLTDKKSRVWRLFEEFRADNIALLCVSPYGKNTIQSMLKSETNEWQSVNASRVLIAVEIDRYVCVVVNFPE